MDFFAPISFYASTSGSSKGVPMPLAEFMVLGNKYKDQIFQYRKMKNDLSELNRSLRQKQSSLDSLDCIIKEGVNPLLPNGDTIYQDSVSEFNNVKAVIDSLKAEIKNLDKSVKNFKRRLPSATLSGWFEPNRNEDCLKSHSGFICIDIDDHFNERDSSGHSVSYSQSLDGVMDMFRDLPWVVYAAHSVGGVGVFALIPLGPIDSHHTHKWYFECLEQEFLRYGFVIDKACSDITRLRIVSYDENPYRNPKAVHYTGISNFIGKTERQRIANEERRKRAMADLHNRMNNDFDKDIRNVGICIDKLVRLGGCGIAEKYEDWTAIGMSLANAFGNDGRSFFHAISSTSSKYNVSDTDKAYDGFVARKSGKSTIASLFKKFEDVGVRWYEKSR